MCSVLVPFSRITFTLNIKAAHAKEYIKAQEAQTKSAAQSTFAVTLERKESQEKYKCHCSSGNYNRIIRRGYYLFPRGK